MFTQKWMDTYFTVDIAIQIGISLCILLLFLLLLFVLFHHLQKSRLAKFQMPLLNFL